MSKLDRIRSRWALVTEPDDTDVLRAIEAQAEHGRDPVTVQQLGHIYSIGRAAGTAYAKPDVDYLLDLLDRIAITASAPDSAGSDADAVLGAIRTAITGNAPG